MFIGLGAWGEREKVMGERASGPWVTILLPIPLRRQHGGGLGGNGQCEAFGLLATPLLPLLYLREWAVGCAIGGLGGAGSRTRGWGGVWVLT